MDQYNILDYKHKNEDIYMNIHMCVCVCVISRY